VQLDAVEAGVLYPPGGDPELLDDSGDFLERAVRRDWHPPVLGQRNALEGDDRGREGTDAAGHMEKSLSSKNNNRNFVMRIYSRKSSRV
jgi:hypothetical protein